MAAAGLVVVGGAQPEAGWEGAGNPLCIGFDARTGTERFRIAAPPLEESHYNYMLISEPLVDSEGAIEFSLCHQEHWLKHLKRHSNGTISETVIWNTPRKPVFADEDIGLLVGEECRLRTPIPDGDGVLISWRLMTDIHYEAQTVRLSNRGEMTALGSFELVGIGDGLRCGLAWQFENLQVRNDQAPNVALVALSRDGHQEWSMPLDFSDHGYPPRSIFLVDGILFMVSREHISRIDLRSGKFLWRTPANDVQSFNLQRQIVCFVCNQQLVCLSSSTGDILSSSPVPEDTRILAGDGEVVVWAGGGELVCEILTSPSRILWRRPLPDHPVVAAKSGDPHVFGTGALRYAFDLDGMIYLRVSETLFVYG